MIPSDSDPGRRDTLLVRLARRVFDETTLNTMVLPAIADARHELHAAGAGAQRVRARWHAVSALVRLSIRLYFEPPTYAPGVIRPHASRRDEVVLLMLAVAFYATFGRFSVAALLAGLTIAPLVHWWYRTRAGAPGSSGLHRSPEINLASVPVGADAGGLITVIGSVAIMLVGIPGLAAYVVVAVVAAFLLAAGLVHWHQMHPASIKPANTLLTRN